MKCMQENNSRQNCVHVTNIISCTFNFGLVDVPDLSHTTYYFYIRLICFLNFILVIY